MSQSYDIVITGGGMAGATAAISFAQLGLSVALIEAVEPEQELSTSYDQRAVALSASSVAIYRSLGLWSELESVACPIKNIHVSDQGRFGFTRLAASDYLIDSLGEVILLEQAGPILWAALKQYPLIDIYCPAKLEKFESEKNYCRLTISQSTQTKDSDTENNQQLSTIDASLMIAADGTYSRIAETLNLPINREPYHQHAVIANISTDKKHDNHAFERFTNEGPLALLPLTANRMSLVWCHKPENADEVMAWDDGHFIEALQQAFGYRLGRITKVGKRYQYPLSLHHAQQHFSDRVLLFGNAAHTLHPIAGQGLNLSLRDIAALTDCLSNACLSNSRLSEHAESSRDFGNGEFLADYIQSRQADWQQTIIATDSLARLFSNDFLPLALVRNKAMNLINRLPFVKEQLANAAMGYSGFSSRLTRGLANQPIFKASK
ncbi:2-octaprenyl-6-methoxyphenyl hydroxylase [Aliikangiella coralliicola]|uniref:2-octaprenyl-6-methoxyphenyl hydroxylase n=1 Tax=Aliikangiella coralliicola TaxID=2592383 RepID=A0A545UI96_9GAMM|nr:2-octaprenyl-6-methoxyphenyl hydroxylase [Aliikangiella coralliicola]TQV89185.1 2-octaprenyl-6-methoxyphenyl hydroxylase [Aliikangiella coralliicola]